MFIMCSYEIWIVWYLSYTELYVKLVYKKGQNTHIHVKKVFSLVLKYFCVDISTIIHFCIDQRYASIYLLVVEVLQIWFFMCFSLCYKFPTIFPQRYWVILLFFICYFMACNGVLPPSSKNTSPLSPKIF